MSRPRRPRALTAEERRLWALVARQAVPLPGRALPEEPAPPEPPPVAQTAAAAPPPTPRRRAPSASPPLAPLAPLEQPVRRALRRGRRGVDAVIDLHGMRQADAHGALAHFLHRSQTQGHAVVLVITGKGAEGAEAGAGHVEERGVLRRVVPHWLRLPDLRGLVLGFEEAARQHGGAGALYVRLRRRGRG